MCVYMLHKNPWAAAWPEGILSLASRDSQWGWREWSAQTGREGSDSPEGREKPAPCSNNSLGQPVSAHVLFTKQCLLFPASSAHSQTLRAGPFSLNSSFSLNSIRRRDRTPLLPPTSGKGIEQGPRDLSLNSTSIYSSSKRNKVLCSA